MFSLICSHFCLIRHLFYYSTIGIFMSNLIQTGTRVNFYHTTHSLCIYTRYLFAMGKISSDNRNLRILHYNTKKSVMRYWHKDIFRNCTSDYPRIDVKPRFRDNSEICLLFSRKQHIFIICC